MLHPFSPLAAMPSSSSSSSSSSPSPKPKRNSNPNPNPNSANPNSGSLPPCRHSAAATLDVLILILVLFSCAFLIISSLAHLVRALSTLLPPLLRPLAASFHASPLPYVAALLLLLLLLIAGAVAAAEISCGTGSWYWPFWSRRRCGNPRCRGLRRALEFDVQLQTEDALRSPPDAAAAAMWREIDGLPWKGGQQGNNPDYECLRAELRRMAPPNGRAVLLFRSRCGCPVAKLEGWGPKRGRRQKKGMANLALEGGR